MMSWMRLAVVSPIIALSIAAPSLAEGYRCVIKGSDKYSRKLVPDIVTFQIDDASGRARVEESRASDPKPFETFGDLSISPNGNLVFKWRGATVKQGRPTNYLYRLSVKKSSGAARLRSSVGPGMNVLNGTGTCTRTG